MLKVVWAQHCQLLLHLNSNHLRNLCQSATWLDPFWPAVTAAEDMRLRNGSSVGSCLATLLADPRGSDRPNLHGACQLRPPQDAVQESCPALIAEAMWTRPLSTPAVATPLQPCSHSPDSPSHIQAAESAGPAAGGGTQQMLLLLTEQVSRLASRVDSLTQTAQTAPADELPARQTEMHLKVVQQELRHLLEHILHMVTGQMQPAREPLPAPAMLEAVQQALTPHLKGVAAQQQQQLADAAKYYENSTRLMLEHFAEQQSAQQQQLVQQLVRRNPTSSASGAALRSSSHTSPANSSGGEYSALFVHWS